jgi:hypothetical protein
MPLLVLTTAGSLGLGSQNLCERHKRRTDLSSTVLLIAILGGIAEDMCVLLPRLPVSPSHGVYMYIDFPLFRHIS